MLISYGMTFNLLIFIISYVLPFYKWNGMSSPMKGLVLTSPVYTSSWTSLHLLCLFILKGLLVQDGYFMDLVVHPDFPD